MQKVQHLCDLCYLNGGENIADNLGIQVGMDKNQMVVDLCYGHKIELDEALDPFFRAGRRPDIVIAVKPPTRKGGQKPTLPGDYQCPVKDCPRSFTGNQAVSMHLTRVHRIPGLTSVGPEAHAAAIAAASPQDVAGGTTAPVKYVDEKIERKRAADRARKQRARDEQKAHRVSA